MKIAVITSGVKRALLLIGTCAVVSTLPVETVQAESLALVGGTLIDGRGGMPIRDSVVLIRDDRIEAVGTVDTLAVPADYERISTDGMTVLPGLWDPHVHLLYSGHDDFGHWFQTYTADDFRTITIPASAAQFLRAGVTSVRDLAVTTDGVMEARRRIAEGEIPGPTIFTAGAALAPGGAFGPHITSFSGTADARAKTLALIEAGVDVIKVFGAGPDNVEDLRAVVETAHAADLTVTAHGRTDEEIRVGLAAGIDEFQHIGTGSPEYPPDVVAMIRERIRTGPPLYWSPTIGPQLNADELAADREFLEAPKNFVGLPERIVEDIRSAIAAAELQAPNPDTVSAVRRKLDQLQTLGVTFISGSDEGTFGAPATEATWRDLEAWVRELGMSPLDAITWATADAAEYLGVGDEVGTVTAGKYADVIAVPGNPLQHFDVLREPAIVIKHGQRVP